MITGKGLISVTDFSSFPEVLQSLVLDGLANEISCRLDWFYAFAEDNDLEVIMARSRYCFEFYLAIDLYREWYAIFSDDGQVDLWQESCIPEHLELYPKYYQFGSEYKGGDHKCE